MALAVGLLVYLSDREASRAVLQPSLAIPGLSHVFGLLGQWLPSFVHPLAFSLFTAAVLKPSTAARLGACAFWGAVNVAFELGQHAVFKPSLLEASQGWTGGWVATRAIVQYELRGTYDGMDLCAVALGVLAAPVLIGLAERSQESPHARP
jgi:hypothetical protein